MVLAAGLTSRREPASFSRRLVEAAIDRMMELVLTEKLSAETRAVLVDEGLRGHLPTPVADALQPLRAPEDLIAPRLRSTVESSADGFRLERWDSC